MTERIQTQETEEETADESLACLECGGNVVAGGERGETVCAGCGLVAEDGEVGRGPDWRAFDPAEREKVPRSLDESAGVSRVGKSEIARTYRYVAREFGLDLKPADHESYVPRFASELDRSEGSERRARQPLRNVKEQGVHSGKSPVGLAAAVYAALLTDERTTQATVSDVMDISEVTIPSRYHELLEAEQDLPGV